MTILMVDFMYWLDELDVDKLLAALDLVEDDINSGLTNEEEQHIRLYLREYGYCPVRRVIKERLVEIS